MTNNNYVDKQPRWSPDGSKIAFSSERDGNSEVYVMDADGSNVVRLTSSVPFDWDPRWSPDGSKIAYTSNIDELRRDIFVINSDATNNVGLTSSHSNNFNEETTWSPDSKKIAFSSGFVSEDYDVISSDIFVVDLDGNDLTNITNSPSFEFSPSWFPFLTITEVNQTPNIPTLTGPSAGIIRESYSFSATATDSDRDDIAYKFDWGDGNISDWTSFYLSGTTVTKSHLYTSAGTFIVKVKAKDINGNETHWSNSKSVTLINVRDISIKHPSSLPNPMDELEIIIEIDNLRNIDDINLSFYSDSPGNPIPASIIRLDNKIEATIKTLPICPNIKYRITEINNFPTLIESEMNISSFYVTDYLSRNYDLLKHAYNFRNAFCDAKEIRKMAREVGVENMPLTSALETCRWIGKCFGMAASSNVYFMDHSAKPEDFRNTETFDFPKEDLVIENISRYQNSQSLYLQPWKKLIDVFGAEDMEKLLKNIVDILKTNKPVLLPMLGHNKKYGHAVSCFKIVEDLNSNKGYLFLYDSNRPSEISRAEIDLINNQFKYFVGDYNYTKAEAIEARRLISIREIRERITRFIRQTMDDLQERNIDVLALGSPARMLVTDTQGRKVGFIDGANKVNEIPNSEIVEFGEANGYKAYLYYIPNDLEYEIKYFGMDEGTMDIEIVASNLSANPTVMTYRTIPITPETIATLEVKEDREAILEVDTNSDGIIDRNYVLDKLIITAIEESETHMLPKEFHLSQNYPNPFNSHTTIQFDIPRALNIELNIFDINGQLVNTLVSGGKDVGQHFTSWNGVNNDGEQVGSGVYLLRLETDAFTETKRMMFLK